MSPELIHAWERLALQGAASEAERFYYDKLFPGIQAAFVEKYRLHAGSDLLISILGLSPEPIILTALALVPTKHVVVTTSDQPAVNAILDRYLEDQYEMMVVGESFSSIYGSMKDVYFDFPGSKITIDITGGKKSHVAAASIFGKDYGCKIVYVDFAGYIKDLRRPLPGSEMLEIVYDPIRDQPELYYGGKRTT